VSIAYLVGFTLVISLLINSFWLKQIKRKNLGQTIREDGPKHHHMKAGTPTMGGVAIFSSLMVVALLFLEKITIPLWGLIVVVLMMMVLGVVDDYLKVVRGKNKGIKAREKFLVQFLISAGFMLLLINNGYDFSHLSNSLPGWLYFIWGVFIITGSSNAVNLTDGLDGLATGLSVLTFAGLAYLAIAINYNYYIFGLLIIFSLVAFLYYNTHPAKIFMGDAGSLPMGALMGGYALLLKVELFLIPFAIIFIIEVVSVILQVGYFKISGGKRLFKMSPFHHHLELSGWGEQKVVRFLYLLQLISVSAGIACYHVC